MKSMSAVAAGMVIATAVPVASACVCSPRPPRQALAQADKVFEGQVIEREPGEYRTVAATFRVLRAWKGVNEREVVVHTLGSESSCGLDFAKGQRWLLYAEDQRDMTLAFLCSGKESSNAEEDFKALGAPSFTTTQGCAGCSTTEGTSTAKWWWFGLFALGLRRRRSAVGCAS